MPRARQLLLRIDGGLVEPEFRAWTGDDESGGVEFDIPPIDDMAKVGTLARYVRMLCDDLKSEASDLSHPLVANRVASGLVSLLLASMPNNKTRAIEKVGKATAPFFVRRAEQFIEEHARDAIVLADRQVSRASARERCKWDSAASAIRRPWRICDQSGWIWRGLSWRRRDGRADRWPRSRMRSASATSDGLPAITMRASANCPRTRFSGAASRGRAELETRFPCGGKSL